MKGEEVKLKLKKAGVSITEIASLLGMSRQSLSQALTVQKRKTIEDRLLAASQEAAGKQAEEEDIDDGFDDDEA